MLEPKHNSPFYKADGKDYLHMPPAIINAYIKDVITPHLDISVEFVPTIIIENELGEHKMVGNNEIAKFLHEIISTSKTNCNSYS